MDETRDEPERGRLTIKAVITRADGTVEDLGVISEGRVSFDTPGPTHPPSGVENGRNQTQ